MNNRLNFCLGLSGILAAFINSILIIILDIITPGYNSIRQYVSEFGIIPGATSFIVSSWWICFGILMIIFSMSLNRSITISGKGYWIGPLLIALYGLLDSIGSSIFPMDPGGVSKTFSVIMHVLVSFLGTTAIIISPLPLIFRMKKDPYWKSLIPFAWSIQIFFGLIYIICCAAFSGIVFTSYIGLLQRTFITAADIWLATLSYFIVKKIKNITGSTQSYIST